MADLNLIILTKLSSEQFVLALYSMQLIISPEILLQSY